MVKNSWLNFQSKIYSFNYPNKEISWKAFLSKGHKAQRMDDSIKYYASLTKKLTKFEDKNYQKVLEEHKKLTETKTENIDENFTRHILVGNIRKIDQEGNTKHKKIGELMKMYLKLTQKQRKGQSATIKYSARKSASSRRNK